MSDPVNSLKQLGETAEQVAKSLRSLGITGERKMSRDCPLANYLKNLGYLDPSVGVDVFFTKEDDMYHLPDVCADFLKQFDSGGFTEYFG